MNSSRRPLPLQNSNNTLRTILFRSAPPVGSEREIFFAVSALLLLAFLMIAVGKTASAAPSRQPAPLLLSHARHVTSLSKNLQVYCWLPHNRVLLVYSDGGDYSELDAITQWRGHAQILDLKTGQKRRLLGFTKMLNQAQGTPGRFETSPDGTWLKWINYETGDGWPMPVVAHFDGSHFQRFSQDKFSVTYWLDNHRWAEQETRSGHGDEPFQLVVYDVNRSQKPKRLPLKSRQAQNLLKLRRNPPVQIPGFSGGDRFLRGNYFDRYSRPIPIQPIRIPAGMTMETLPTASRHNSLAYTLSQRVRSASPHLSKKGKSMEVESLWFRHLDGSALRRLGYVNGKNKIEHLQWMPDGKHVSFVYQRGLYVVSAEAGK